MKSYLLSPVCFVATFLGCMFFLIISDIAICAGNTVAPELLVSYLHTIDLRFYIGFHLLPSLLITLCFVQIYLFFKSPHLWMNVLMNIVFSVLVIFLLIPLFFMVGNIGAESDSVVHPKIQTEIPNRIFQNENKQFVAIGNNLVTADPGMIPVLSSERSFTMLDYPENGVMNELMQDSTFLVNYRLIESLTVNYFYQCFKRGWRSYLLSVGGIVLLLASLWPFLKFSAWKVLNIFAFAAAIAGCTVIIQYFVSEKFINSLSNTASFFSIEFIPLICTFLLSLLLNLIGVASHILHKIGKGAAND